MAATTDIIPIEQIIAVLRSHFPELKLDASQDSVSVSGTYKLKDGDRWIASYLILIELPKNYPHEIPLVYETGGVIPRNQDHHINKNNTLCLGIPEELWIEYNGTFDLLTLLNGPIRTFFLGVTNKLAGKGWPYGERGHGAPGLCEFYGEAIGTTEALPVLELIELLTKKTIKGHLDCPCGSGQRLRNCHGNAIRALHAKSLPKTMLRNSAIYVARHLQDKLDQQISQLEKMRLLARRIDVATQTNERRRARS